MRLGIRVVSTAVAFTVLASGVDAVGAGAEPAVPVTPSVADLQVELRGGALAADHGVVDVCAAHGLGCDVQVVTASRTSDRPLVTDAPVGYGPAELASAYEIPSRTTGAGLVAVIVPGADPALASDSAIYRARYGLPACTTASGCFRQLDYLGGAPYEPTPTAGNPRDAEEYEAFEATLDVEMVMAGCPGCRVVEIQLPLSDTLRGGVQAAKDYALHVATGVQLAKRLGAEAVGMSLLLPAYTYSDHTLASMMTTPGMALVAASGDDGDLPSPSWPQNLPTVTSVGGTSLYRDTNARGWTETAWHGSGSSCAYDVGPAAGQPTAVSSVCAIGAQQHRASSDISAVADPYTGVAVYDSYAPSTGVPPGWQVSGGTSASAPWIAGLYARAPQRAGVTGPDTVYAAPATAFHDVTIGTTSTVGTCGMYTPDPLVLCNAGPGWDGPTGRGTPHGLAAL